MTRWRTCKTAPRVDWLGRRSSRRGSCCRSTSPKTHLIASSTKYPRARISRTRRASRLVLEGSLAFTRKIDEAAACM